MAHWGYCKSNGPDTWGKVAPAAKGDRQSPIDIVPADAVYSEALARSPLQFKYDPYAADKLINTGHSAQLTFKSEGSSLFGGPLGHKYQVAQLHLHWGKEDDTGSEHRIDGKMAAAELHIVHWNTELFASAAEAMKENDGLCVLGVFLKPGKEHLALKKMTDQLADVPFNGDNVPFVGGMDPATLLPEDTSKYYTYLGSLTTPPCFESVTWVVYADPIEVSEEQLTVFRNLKQYSQGGAVEPGCEDFDGYIVENYRPPLPKDDRLLRASFTKL